LTAILAIAWTLATISQPVNNEYTIHIQQPWNQIENYPVTSQPIPPNYQPVNTWVGRLILPPEIGFNHADWVNFEIQQAPNPQLIGKIVRLAPKLGWWDVSFTMRTRQSMAQGNIHPLRLNNHKSIGALQSLAGSRPTDNQIGSFPVGKLVGDVLQIETMPTLTTGRIYALVKIIAQDRAADRFLVQHYNSRTHKFDDRMESIVIPRQVIDRREFAPSTTDRLLSSPAGADGWYVYGAIDRQGIFTAQALQPRSLIQVNPTPDRRRQLVGLKLAQEFLDRHNWQINKGELSTTSMTTKSTKPEYHQGDRALVLHLFGGIGGEKAESLGVPQTISGHFAFGTATVVVDPFTQSLIWDIQYHQVYAHNPNGIVAGTHTWADYLGNLQWGWAATRPISDLLITLPAITQDYDFDGVKLSLLAELQHNLEIMMARYRVGDGTGSSTVSIATSCVQDTNQALYTTLKSIQQQAENPQIQRWLSTHPQAAQTQRFHQLKSIGDALEKQLMPWGITRADWAHNSLAGTHPHADDSFWAGVTSWRSILPRRAHDRLAMLFMRQGADVQVLRTNQIGGWQSQIAPLAPTSLFGLITLPFTDFAPLPIAMARVLAALALLSWQDIGVGIGLLAIYSVVSIAIGWKSGFLCWQPHRLTRLIVWLLFAPALAEELIFRVMWLPHPSDVVDWFDWSLWAIVGLCGFVIYHPINAKTFYQAGNPTFFQPIFLLLAGLLGLTCSIAYAITGSLLVITLIHWIVVTAWIFYGGGMDKLRANIPK
jgi:predicted Abi (CAAX) family protease